MIKNSNTRLVFSSAALLGMALAASQPAHAQRQRTDDERQQQRQDRRDRAQNMTPEQRMQALQQRMANMTPDQRARMMERAGQWLQNMTPDQQQQMLQNLPPEMQQQAKALLTQQRPGAGATGRAGTATTAAELAKWNWIRRALTTAGYTDGTLQDAVIAFMQAQEKAHLPLQEKARALATILVKPDTPTAQLTTELTSFRKAVADDKTRYNTELADLDKKISFSKQPRLESLLSVIGAVGYEVPEIGGLNAVYPNTGVTNGGATRGNGTAGGRNNRGGGNNRGGRGNRAGGGGATTQAAAEDVAPAGNAPATTVAAGEAPTPAA